MSAENTAKIQKTMMNMLNAFNERDVESTLSNFYFDDNFLSYGLDGAKISNREETRRHLEDYFSKTAEIELEVVWSKVSVYRIMATFVGECTLKFRDSVQPNPIPIRLTAVLRDINDRWKVNQLHFSTDALTQAA